MDKIEKIRQEIERRITDNTFGAKLELIDILAWLDTLSEEPDKSLEGAAEEYIKKGRYLPEAFYVRPAFIAGANWQKTQMMKEAVEGEVIKTDKHTSVRYKAFYGTDRYFYGIADKQFKPGDKVRIIIVKEENK